MKIIEMDAGLLEIEVGGPLGLADYLDEWFGPGEWEIQYPIQEEAPWIGVDAAVFVKNGTVLYISGASEYFQSPRGPRTHRLYLGLNNGVPFGVFSLSVVPRLLWEAAIGYAKFEMLEEPLSIKGTKRGVKIEFEGKHFVSFEPFSPRNMAIFFYEGAVRFVVPGGELCGDEVVNGPRFYNVNRKEEAERLAKIWYPGAQIVWLRKNL